MVQFKVSTKISPQLLTALSKKTISLSMDDLGYVMRKAKDFAQEQYSIAKYDGEDPAETVELTLEKPSPQSISLTASAQTIEYIEFGTGVQGKNAKPWWFRARGRNVVTKSTGKLMTTRRYKRTTRETKGSESFFLRKAPDIKLKPTQVARDEKGYYAMSKGVRYDVGRIETFGGRESVPEYWVEKERHDQDAVYRTYGNPPAGVMSKTREFIFDEIAKMERRYKGR